MNRKKKKSSILNPQSLKLKWVYPPNHWKTNSNRTFIYGFSDPKAKLFIVSDEYLVPEKVKVFSNGNFAQTIKLPDIKNKVKLIQVLNGKRKTLSRNILIDLDRTKKQKKSKTKIKHKKHAQRTTHNAQLCIVIDPGHGGKEHGTHSPKGIPESIYNLQVSKLLCKKLKSQSPKLKVYMTRTKNGFVSLSSRVDFAKRKKCDLLISIHHNALPDKEDPLKHRGVGIYYAHDYMKPQAFKFLNSICRATGLSRYGVFKRDFALTRPTFCKALLIECGFLTHPLEANYVTSKKTQAKIVQGIVNALSDV